MGDSEVDIEQLFQQGVAAIRAGDKAKARELLTKVVEANQLHEQAWLWLSAAVTDKDEQILCLENVLTINPKNEIAQKGLRKLKGEPEPAPAPAPPPPVQPEPPPPPKPAEDAWRARLKDTEYTSEATIVKPMHEGPQLGIGDLANAWMWAAIFQVPGPYEEEVDYGPVSHIFISIGLAVFLTLLAIGLGVSLAITNTKLMAQVRAAMPRNASPSLQNLVPTAGSMATLGTLLLIAFAIAVVVIFVSLGFQSFITNMVAGWLGGKGTTLSLLQALTIALVPTQLVMILVYIASALLTGAPSLIILFGGWLYQFLQTSNAVNASHKLGIFASMGAVIISGFAMGILYCCLSFGSSLLFGGGGARR